MFSSWHRPPCFRVPPWGTVRWGWPCDSCCTRTPLWMRPRTDHWPGRCPRPWLRTASHCVGTTNHLQQTQHKMYLLRILHVSYCFFAKTTITIPSYYPYLTDFLQKQQYLSHPITCILPVFAKTTITIIIINDNNITNNKHNIHQQNQWK